MDFASLVAGSRLYLVRSLCAMLTPCADKSLHQPVFVDGAKLSLGDVHFCEGDGEPTTAIEMSGAYPRVTRHAPQYLSHILHSHCHHPLLSHQERDGELGHSSARL